MSSLISPESELSRTLKELETAVSEQKEQDVHNKFTKLMEIIAANGNLWKRFKTWTGKDISKEISLHRSDVAKVETLIQKTGILTESNLTSLKINLLRAEQLHAGNLTNRPFGDASHSVVGATLSAFSLLKEFDSDFLREIMTKNHKRLEKLIQFINLYNSLKETVSLEQKIF